MKLPLELCWRRGPDMPFATGDYLQSVMVQGTLYVGGGFGGYSDGGTEYIVMGYDTHTREWSKLPPYVACNSAMVAIDEQLVLVSGYEHSHRTKKLGVWVADSREWTHPYPNMLVGRSSPSAVVYTDWLIVAGGRGDGGRLASVEAMNISHKEWHNLQPMPVPWARMKTAVVGRTCYLLGGGVGDAPHTCNVYSVSLPTLLNSRKSVPESSHVIWKKVSALEGTTLSCPLSFGGSLLALGGWDKDHVESTLIRLYKPDSDEWVEVGEMQTPRHNFTCVMISETEMMVAGGDVNSNDGYLNTVDLATVG